MSLVMRKHSRAPVGGLDGNFEPVLIPCVGEPQRFGKALHGNMHRWQGSQKDQLRSDNGYRHVHAHTRANMVTVTHWGNLGEEGEAVVCTVLASFLCT